MIKPMLPVAAFAASLFAGGAATAQESGIIACSSQDALVQHLASDGELVPSGCHPMNVVVMEHEGRQLCTLDVTAAAEGFVGETIGGALPTQWWTDCAALAGQLN
jgi:hypothetical protein